ncbi:MAG: phosphate ABC transporter permease PstA [Candidatus Woesearchaeota archaeon]
MVKITKTGYSNSEINNTENIKQSIYFALFKIAIFFSVIILLFVIAYVFIKGYRVIDIDFLTKMWSHQDITSGGIFPAILGSILLGLGLSIIAVPIGVCTAIYLNEYAKENIVTRIIKLSIRNLAGIPSIVYGMFGLAFFVLFINLGTSLIAASLTLSCMTLPWIITASEESMKAVPMSFREASYALGATKWQTIKKIVLPSSMSGILTGAILGVSRAIGETAPIIMVGATFYMDYIPLSIFDKFMALPYHLFIMATQHSSPDAKEYAAGIALILILIIFLLNIGVFILRYKLRKKKDW